MPPYEFDPPSSSPPYCTRVFLGKYRVPSSPRMSPPTVARLRNHGAAMYVAVPLTMVRRVSSSLRIAPIAARLRVVPPNQPNVESVRASGEPRSPPAEVAEDVVVVVWQVRLAAEDLDVGVDGELGRRQEVEVGARRLPLKLVVGQRAEVAVAANAHEVAVALPTAPPGPPEEHVGALAEPTLVDERVVADERSRGLAAAQRVRGVGGDECRRRVGQGADREVVGRGPVLVHRPELAAHRLLERVGPGAPALGDDLDDARRRVGAVQRGGGRALHDLDRLDVVGVDVVQAVGGLVGARSQRSADALEEPHAVDEDDRLVGERERRRAAHPDLPRRARRARPRGDRHARHPRLEDLVDGRDGRVGLDVRDADRGDLGRLGAALLVAQRARHDDLGQRRERRSQGEVDGGGPAPP